MPRKESSQRTERWKTGKKRQGDAMRGALLLLLSLLSFCWSEPALEEALLELPKLELHAHIHGSLRRSTMVELASQLNMTAGMKVSLDKYDHGVADKPFELFPIVHAIVSSKEVVTRIVTEIIEDYQSQNCIYLELRTTPRALRDGTTMEEYLRTVLDVISAYNAQRRDQMLVKLVVSIDRSKRYSEAVEALELAKKLAMRGDERLIVGIDFSGNPLGGRFEDFRPVLEDARSFGFNLTIHTAEARALSEPPPETDGADETSAILAFRPDRIGHLLYAQERHFQQLAALKATGRAPQVEICPTTAFFLLGLTSYANHPHFRRLAAQHLPLSVNTDDSGVFSTSLTAELSHAMLAFGLDLEAVLALQVSALDYAFVTGEERARLQESFWKQVAALAAGRPGLGLRPDLRARLTAPDDEAEADMSHLYTM